MEHAGTLETQGTPKASDFFPPYLVRLEFFLLCCTVVLMLFAPTHALNNLFASMFMLLWIWISRSIAEYRNTKVLPRQNLSLKLTIWGFPVAVSFIWILRRFVDLPSLSEVTFWVGFGALAVCCLFFRRIEISRFDEQKKHTYNQFQEAAKERYRGWVLIYFGGVLSVGLLWGILSATMVGYS